MTHIVIPTSDLVGALNFDATLAIDISSFTGSDDYISFSLPEFPAAKLDLEQTFVDFTSHPKGDFGIGPTDQISFMQADPPLGSLSGDTEMRIPISALANVDKNAIIGIRFRLYAEEDCAFRCLSIRACSANWKYAPIDVDTLWDRVERPPSTNGTIAQESEFPVAGEAGWPKDWPILFRADNPTGSEDPLPIDIKVAASFATGSFEQATGEGENINSLALYMRDVPEDDQIQVELNSLTQAQLNQKGSQPDFGTAAYVTRDQEQLSIYDQNQLDQDTQFTLERSPDFSTHSWLEVKLEWGNKFGKLTIFNADEEGFAFNDISLEAVNSADLDKGRYVLLVELVNDAIRARIFRTTQLGEIEDDNLIFDSGTIKDDTLIKRRKGRFGWWTQLLDGDAYLYNIKTRGLNFGELISKEFKSITPVRGVSLYAGATTDTELVTEVSSTNPGNTLVTLDPAATPSGEALKITTVPLQSLQGIITNSFLIDDPDNLDFSFDIKFPSSEAPGGGLSIFLLGDNNQIVPIRISAFDKNTWSHVKLFIKNTPLFQTGLYRLVLIQTLPVVATTWWIENLSVKTSSIKWSARPQAEDAWETKGNRWHNVGFTLNSLNGGVVFDEIGDGLQIRGQVARQDAEIHDYKAIPKYATLGRRVWSDQIETDSAPTGLSIEATIEEHDVAFKASGTDSDGSIVAYYWSFGDDTYDSGQIINHTYTNLKPRTYEKEILADAPKMYWRLGEPSGETAVDSSGHENVGEYRNSPTHNIAGAIKDDSNGAVEFNGTNQSVRAAAYNPYVVGGVQTFTGWAWRDVSTAEHTLIGSRSLTNEPALTLANGSQNVTWATTGAGSVTWTGAWPGNAQWVHWALVYDDPNNKASLYINGSLISTKEQTSVYEVPGIFALGLRNEGSAFFDGRNDEVAIFDYALSAERIKAHYEAGINGLRAFYTVTLIAKDDFGNSSSTQKVITLTP